MRAFASVIFFCFNFIVGDILFVAVVVVAISVWVLLAFFGRPKNNNKNVSRQTWADMRSKTH